MSTKKETIIRFRKKKIRIRKQDRRSQSTKR